MTERPPIADPLPLAELTQENAEYRSDCQRLESALQESDRRFKALLYNLPEKVFHKDRDSVYVSCNRNYAVDFGLEPEQMVGKTDCDLFPPDIAAKYRADDHRIMASGETEEIEEIYCAPNGEERLIRTVKAALRDEHGHVTGVLGIFSDITERKRAENALRESQRRLNTLIANLPGAVYRCKADSNWTIEFLSDGYFALTGCRPSEMVGHPGTRHAELIHPEDRQHEFDLMQAAIARKSSFQVEYRLRTASGEERWAWEQGVGIFSEEGGLEAIEGFTADITDRKRAEKERQASEAKYRRLYQGMMDAFVSVSMDGQIQEFNDAYCQMLGYSPDELYALTYHDLTPSRWHPFEAEIVRDQVLRRGYSDTYEKEYRRKDGTIVPVELRTYVIADEKGGPNAMWAIIRDITERKATEAALQRSHDELEQKVRERTADLVKSNDSLRAEIQERLRAEHELSQSEAKYRALVESSPDAVVMCDLEGSILFASQRAAEQHGCVDARELVGRPATDFVVPEDRDMMKENIRRLVQEGIRRNHQYRALRRDGQVFFGEISAAVIRDAAGNLEALMGVYRDISEHKRTELAVQKTDAELLAAAEIQAYLLPHAPPQVEGFDIAGRCYSAKAAAGDHFDFLCRPDGSLLIVLGDVSGHGLGPAIVAAGFCARLRTLSEIPCELTEMAVKVHAGLYRETAGAVFVTAILGRLDPKSRTFACLNAGHPPAIVLNSAGKENVRLDSGGLPFAVLEETPFVAGDPLELRDGDLLFFYTDGLTEAQRDQGPQFGLDRAIQIVRDNQDRTAAEIIEAVYHAACEHIAPEKPKDDITVVVVKVLAGASESSSAGAPVGTLDAKLFVPGDSGKKSPLIERESFAVEQCDDAMVVRFVDTRHFDTEKYVQLQQDLVDFIERQKPHLLLLDLGSIEFCSTAFINALLMAQRRVQAGSGKMKLFGLHGILLEAMQHLKLIDTVLSVYADETAAKHACG